jgi:hypothetical protein
MLPALLLSLALSQNGPGTLIVTCDCNFSLFLDGSEMNTGNIRNNVRVDNVEPGRHSIQISMWSNPFHHEVIYDGYVDVTPGAELRAKASRGKLEIYGKSPNNPPPPAFDSVKFNELLGDVVDILKEAQEAAEDDDDTKCASKVGGKLEALRDMVKDLRHDPSRAGVVKAQRKLQDVQEAADDKCSRRVAKKVDKKLEKASLHLVDMMRLAP